MKWMNRITTTMITASNTWNHRVIQKGGTMASDRESDSPQMP